MSKPLDQSSLITYIGDLLNESVSSSGTYHTTAVVVRAINRVLDRIGQTYPVRKEVWRVVGDGSKKEFNWPTSVQSLQSVEIDGAVLAPIDRLDLAYGHHRMTQVGSTYGYTVSGRSLQFAYAPASTNTVDIHCYVTPPALRATVKNGGASDTVTCTNDSKTVTFTALSAALVEGTDIDVGDSFTGPDGNVYTIESLLDSSLTANDTMTLVEAYRGTTATASQSWNIGKHPGIDARWNDAVALLTVAARKQAEGAPDAAEWFARGEEAMRRAGTSQVSTLGQRLSRSRV